MEPSALGFPLLQSSNHAGSLLVIDTDYLLPVIRPAVLTTLKVSVFHLGGEVVKLMIESMVFASVGQNDNVVPLEQVATCSSISCIPKLSRSGTTPCPNTTSITIFR